MAEQFVNSGAAVTTVMTTVYTCPAGRTALILLCQASNVDGVSPGYITLQWLDSSNADAVTRLAKDIGIPAKSAVGLLDGKLALEEGDALQIQADADNLVELNLSVIELY